ncbi:hypothetical protein [Pseudomonas jessenii]|uniref:hypothetical protein n=1 Tax=Pseudomonas jessenii TaxID=77298 RepID=UPI0030BF475F
MSATDEVKDAVAKQIIDYLKTTPQALAFLIMAFASGHLWAYVITNFVKEKKGGNKEIRSAIGRLSLGLVWLASNLVVVYGFVHHSWPRDYAKIIDLIIPTIVLGFFIQLIVLAGVVIFGERP